MLAIISTFSKTFDEVGLVYFVPTFLESEIKIGMIVEVPLKEKIEIWVVLNIQTQENLWLDIETSKIKSLISIKNTNIFIGSYRTELLKFIAKHYFTPIHNSTSLFFPKNLRDKIIKDKIKFENNQYDYEYNYKKTLTIEQKKAYDEIISSKNNKILLHGVTWSWKTEIYIKLIKDNLEKKKQSLLLIPEIILTNQLQARLKEIFWEQVITINSSITEATKTKYWIDIHLNNAKIIIWTRSALFYPYNNLWLIIVDEEHDNSYTSDVSPRYSSIEIAEKITDLNKNLLILWSWTPSINIMYKSLKGNYKLISLLNKYTLN